SADQPLLRLWPGAKVSANVQSGTGSSQTLVSVMEATKPPLCSVSDHGVIAYSTLRQFSCGCAWAGVAEPSPASVKVVAARAASPAPKRRDTAFFTMRSSL